MDFSLLNRPAISQDLIIIGDFLKDLDDEHTLCGVAGLTKLGYVNLKCVLANLDPAQLRARGAKGTLKELGLFDVPVGVGSPVFVGKVYPYEQNIPYLAELSEVEIDGMGLLVRTLQGCEDQSITLVLQSGLTDAAELYRTYSDLFTSKIKNVAVMGGVELNQQEVKLSDRGLMLPNNANNHTFDMPSAKYFYEQMQLSGIPMIITTREVAYTAQVPFEAYDEWEATGSLVGKCLKNRQKPSLQHLWEAACSPPGSDKRGTFPDDRNRQWFVKVFCEGIDPGVEDGADIWPFVGKFNLYDPSSFYAVITDFQQQFLEPTVVEVYNTKHKIFGLTSTNHGVKNPQEFADFMVQIELLGMK